MNDIQEPQKQCFLLMLPAELRNNIFSYILVQPSGLCDYNVPAYLFPGAPPATTRRRFCANILRTCKQINEEASSILYGQNIFSAHSQWLTALPSLLMTVKPYRVTLPPVLLSRPLTLIRRFNIYVRLDTDPQYDQTKVRDCFSNVEELEIQVFQSMYGSCDFTVLELFEAVRGVKKARVYGSIGDGRYAAWLESSLTCASDESITPFTNVGITEKSKIWDSWTNANR